MKTHIPTPLMPEGFFPESETVSESILTEFNTIALQWVQNTLREAMINDMTLSTSFPLGLSLLPKVPIDILEQVLTQEGFEVSMQQGMIYISIDNTQNKETKGEIK